MDSSGSTLAADRGGAAFADEARTRLTRLRDDAPISEEELAEAEQALLGLVRSAEDREVLAVATLGISHVRRRRGAWSDAFFLAERASETAKRDGSDVLASEAAEAASRLRDIAFLPWTSFEEHLNAYATFLRDVLRHHIEIQREAARYGVEGDSGGIGRLSDAEVGAFFERRGPALRVMQQERLRRADRTLALRDAQSREKGFEPPIEALSRRFALSRLDALVLMTGALAAADRSFNRVLRHASNDFSADAFTVSFLAELFAPVLVEGALMPSRIAADAPLGRHALVRFQRMLELPPRQTRSFTVEDCVAETLLGRPTLSERIAEVSDVLHDPGPILREDLASSLAAERLGSSQTAGRGVFLIGLPGSGRRTLSTRVACKCGSAGLVAVRVHGLRGGGTSAPDRLGFLSAAVRDAALLGMGVLFESRTFRDDNPFDDPDMVSALVRVLSGAVVPWFLSSDRPFPTDIKLRFQLAHEVHLDELATVQKQRMWHELEERHGVPATRPDEVDAVLNGLALNPGGLERLYLSSVATARGRTEDAPTIETNDLKRTAVEDVDADMAGIAQRVPLTLDWGDIVLPESTLTELNEILSYARYRTKVMKDWGFDRKLPYGAALSALFYGPPGTGKTMMALIVAKDLGMDLFRVDLSQIMSKYVGETEKNLQRVFDRAQDGRAIILFEEADSLFSKRTGVSSANDRYSNVEVNYLLQKMESFDGVTILTSNNFENIDEAFRRRIRFRVKFPMPDDSLRESLWKSMFPRQARVSKRIDFGALARQFDFAPAYIKSTVLRAAFKAAEQDVEITQELLLEAARTESKQLGLLVRDGGATPKRPAGW